MIITKQAFAATFLPAGASWLPLLDGFAAMLPATTRPIVRRLGFIYFRWLYRRAGRRRRRSDSSSCRDLQSCDLSDQLTVISNLELKNAYPGTHATSNASFLSAAKAKWTESTDYHLGTTVDQVAAQQIGHQTLLPSLELSMDLLQTVGQCDNGYACVYQNNLSWSSPTTPLPAEAHPRVVFERLFGEGGSAADRRAALRKRASLLDSLRDDITRLQAKRGPEDRYQGRRYLQTVREVERRIQMAEAGRPTSLCRISIGRRGAGGVCRTRAVDVRSQSAGAAGRHHPRHTFQLARETSNRTYAEIGAPIRITR